MGYDIEQIIIILLSLILVVLIAVRISLAYRMRQNSGRWQGSAQTCGSRDVQEDCHAVSKTGRGTLAVLADGMGKNRYGVVSSSLAVETVLDLFERDNAFQNPNYFFQKALKQANRRILDQLDDAYGGASVGIALFDGVTLYYSVVGNVQIAVFRKGQLVPVTEGHTVSVLAEKKYLEGSLTRQDTIALLQERRLYNYVGRDEFVDIEIFDQPIGLRHGDIVVLMTDGVYETVPFAQLEEILSENRGCQKKAEAVIRAVNDAPGLKDNASILLISV